MAAYFVPGAATHHSVYTHFGASSFLSLAQVCDLCRSSLLNTLPFVSLHSLMASPCPPAAHFWLACGSPPAAGLSWFLQSTHAQHLQHSHSINSVSALQKPSAFPAANVTSFTQHAHCAAFIHLGQFTPCITFNLKQVTRNFLLVTRNSHLFIVKVHSFAPQRSFHSFSHIHCLSAQAKTPPAPCHKQLPAPVFMLHTLGLPPAAPLAGGSRRRKGGARNALHPPPFKKYPATHPSSPRTDALPARLQGYHASPTNKRTSLKRNNIQIPIKKTETRNL